MRRVITLNPATGCTVVLVWHDDRPAGADVDVWENGYFRQYMTPAQAEAGVQKAKNSGWLIIEEN